jgi:hypothetical protein
LLILGPAGFYTIPRRLASLKIIALTHRRHWPSFALQIQFLTEIKLMSEATETGRLTDEFKGLFTKTIQADIELFNRLSALSSEAVREFFTGPQRKALPSLGESLTRSVELGISYWTAAAHHSLGFANDVAKAYEKALDLKSPSKEPPHRAVKSKVKKTH